MHLESKNPGHIPRRGLDGNQQWIHLKENILERGAKVCAVDGGVPGGFGVVEVFALGAVELDVLGAGRVGHAGGEEVVGFAVDPGAFAEVAFFVFFKLLVSDD